MQALQVPKVALLFLTQGKLPHEATWRAWFAAAEGWLPAAAVVQGSACSVPEGELWRLAAACGAVGTTGAGWVSPAATLSRQHLFSVYVHVPPQFPSGCCCGGCCSCCCMHAL